MKSASPSSSSRTSEIKGTALRNFPDVIATLYGDATRGQTLAGLSPELRGILEHRGIAASGWYPLDWYRELYKAARRATSSPPGLARAIGRESTRQDLGGVYRIFLRVLSPTFVLSLCGRLFGTYYRPGEMTLIESRSGFGRVKFTRCYGFDEDVWNDVIGGCEVAMELAGARDIRVRIEQGGREGDAEATLIAWWAGETNAASDEPPAQGGSEPRT